MLLMLKLTILEKNNLRMLHRSMAFIILLFSFALGARAEVYYIIYYDDTSTSPATRHYVSIDGTKVVDATTFSERCIWFASETLSSANTDTDGEFSSSSTGDKSNRNNRRALLSFTSPSYCLTSSATNEDASNGNSVGLSTSSSEASRWLVGGDESAVLYTYYYNHYVYYDIDSKNWMVSSSADTYTNRAKIAVCADLPAAPVHIACSASGDNITVSMKADEGCTIYYTTDNTSPTIESLLYDKPFNATWGATIKAISVRGDNKSDVTELVLPKEEDGLAVKLNDLEDHSWSYYQTSSPICSPEPCDVQLTYLGNGAAVGIDAPETSFVYQKTLEKDGEGYPYTTIANPFSKRPVDKGFKSWKIKSLSNCSIKDINGTELVADDYVSAESNIIIYPINEEVASIEFEAEWIDANILYCKASEINQKLTDNSFKEGTYETNIIVVTSGICKQALPSTHYPATITMVEPDGSKDYRSMSTRLVSNITLGNNLKLEYVNMLVPQINANANDLVLGRGISHPYHINERSVSTIRGINEDKSEDLDYQLRIESGIYNTLYFVSTSKTCSGSSKRIRSILGCDYDRARKDDTRLKILGQATMGSGMIFTNNTFESSSFHAITKSGTFNANQTSAGSGSASQSFYISMSSNPTNAGSRTLIIEGGTFWNIAGGVDTNGTLEERNDNTSVYIRMKGGTVKGAIYGGGAYAEGYGNRKLVFTGGTVGGWIAAGCNGTQTSGGRTYGRSYVYVGGNTIVANQRTINSAAGGQVFGAGKGYASTDGTSGEMTYGTTVVVADDASIAGDVYGGGFYGYAKEGSSSSSNVYVLGGTIGGNVYGGSNMKGGAPTNITIAGGTVNGDVYGGSNTKGEIASTSITMTGGTVGSNNKGGNIFGGGNQAPVKGNTNVNITGGTVKRNVYGGGNKAAVSGTTNVVIGQ